MTSNRVEMQPLLGARVMLRPLASTDFPAWREVRVRNREWLEPWEPFTDGNLPDPAIDPDAFRSRCGAWDRQRHFDSAYGYGLFLRNGLLVGEISLGSVQRGPYQTAMLGYWVDEARAGQGLVPEAAVVMLRHAFEDLGLHRVEAAIVPRNDRSRRVADKLGLRDEGVAVRLLQIRGVWEDHIRYAITVEEWEVRGDELVERFLAE